MKLTQDQWEFIEEYIERSNLEFEEVRVAIKRAIGIKAEDTKVSEVQRQMHFNFTDVHGDIR